MQLEMLLEEPEKRIEKEIRDIKDQTSSVRKALFARHSSLQKQYLELKHEFEVLKAALCRQNSQIPGDINENEMAYRSTSADNFYLRDE